MEFPDYSQDLNFLSSGGDSDRLGSCVRAAFSLKMLLTRRHIHTVFSGAINTMTSMKNISIARFSFISFFLLSDVQTEFSGAQIRDSRVAAVEKRV